jgi:hypothetical protein
MNADVNNASRKRSCPHQNQVLRCEILMDLESVENLDAAGVMTASGCGYPIVVCCFSVHSPLVHSLT